MEKKLTIEDMQRNPYPYVWGERMILDELCGCGHKRTEHGNTFTFGHGGCKLGDRRGKRGEKRRAALCACSRFTWVKHIARKATKAEKALARKDS